jgi:hypothetical protein
LALQELYQYKSPESHFFEAWEAQLETHLPLLQVLFAVQVPQLMVVPQPLLQLPHW